MESLITEVFNTLNSVQLVDCKAGKMPDILSVKQLLLCPDETSAFSALLATATHSHMIISHDKSQKWKITANFTSSGFKMRATFSNMPNTGLQYPVPDYGTYNLIKLICWMRIDWQRFGRLF